MTAPSLLSRMPKTRGRCVENAPLGHVGWFRCGGSAEILFRPDDADDLAEFLAGLPSDIPVTVLGVLSNTIIRDGGLPGVTIRLGRGFTGIERCSDNVVKTGAAVLDINLAQFSAKSGLTGMEFLSGIPGSIGGALKMNAGAYGIETKDVLVRAHAVERSGARREFLPSEMRMTYRHVEMPEDTVFIGAELQGVAGKTEDALKKMADIKEKREASQPVRERTGGSTFANPTMQELEIAGLPEKTGAWSLIDRVGGRGLIVGGAMMSEKHCNFMINTGNATSADLENLGDHIRQRVENETGIRLRWEIRRIGLPQGTTP